MSHSSKLIRLKPLFFKSLGAGCGIQSTPAICAAQLPQITLSNQIMLSTATAASTITTAKVSSKPQQSIRLFQTKTESNASPNSSFKASDLVKKLVPEKERAAKPAWDKLLFGHHCSDHMLTIHWTAEKGWAAPTIERIQNFSLHPYAKVFHYAQELFEGLKAYRDKDNRIRLFRADMNMKRMKRSAARLCLPDFDVNELEELIKQLLLVEESWVPPYGTNASIYIRPTMMGIEPTLGVSPSNEAILFVVMGPCGPYFSTGQMKPVSLMASPKYVRAWPGGSGDNKLGANYAPTLLAQKEAQKIGHQQVLWLFGDDHQITEVGTMNIFVYSRRSDGTMELATPPLSNGLILPGITRDSLLELTRSWAEFDVVERVITMHELKRMIAEGRLIEVFGAGTACVVCPVGEINYNGEIIETPPPSLSARLLSELTDIQYGVKPHPWSVVVK